MGRGLLIRIPHKTIAKWFCVILKVRESDFKGIQGNFFQGLKSRP